MERAWPGLQATLPQLRLALRQGDVLLAVGVLAILVVLILPLPAMLLDLLPRGLDHARRS